MWYQFIVVICNLFPFEVLLTLIIIAMTTQLFCFQTNTSDLFNILIWPLWHYWRCFVMWHFGSRISWKISAKICLKVFAETQKQVIANHRFNSVFVKFWCSFVHSKILQRDFLETSLVLTERCFSWSPWMNLSIEEEKI